MIGLFWLKIEIISDVKIFQKINFTQVQSQNWVKKNEIIFTSVFQNFVFFGFKSETIYCGIFRKKLWNNPFSCSFLRFWCSFFAFWTRRCCSWSWFFNLEFSLLIFILFAGFLTKKKWKWSVLTRNWPFSTKNLSN